MHISAVIMTVRYSYSQVRFVFPNEGQDHHLAWNVKCASGFLSAKESHTSFMWTYWVKKKKECVSKSFRTDRL